MESIKRLRIRAKGHYTMVDHKLLEIADAIEDEALSMRNLAWNEGYDAGFASADDWLGQHEDAMAEHGWLKLPVDADGVPIRAGDMMDTERGAEEVEGILPGRGRFLVLRDSQWLTLKAATYRHYHKPTVEDVLREFAEKWLDTDRCTKFENEVVAEYAAKLQLKEEA